MRILSHNRFQIPYKTTISKAFLISALAISLIAGITLHQFTSFNIAILSTAGALFVLGGILSFSPQKKNSQNMEFALIDICEEILKKDRSKARAIYMQVSKLVNDEKQTNNLYVLLTGLLNKGISPAAILKSLELSKLLLTNFPVEGADSLLRIMIKLLDNGLTEHWCAKIISKIQPDNTAVIILCLKQHADKMFVHERPLFEGNVTLIDSDHQLALDICRDPKINMPDSMASYVQKLLEMNSIFRMGVKQFKIREFVAQLPMINDTLVNKKSIEGLIIELVKIQTSFEKEKEHLSKDLIFDKVCQFSEFVEAIPELLLKHKVDVKWLVTLLQKFPSNICMNANDLIMTLMKYHKRKNTLELLMDVLQEKEKSLSLD